MPSAISPAIWIIFLSGGRTWLVAFCGRARGDEVRAGKHIVVSCFSVQHYKASDAHGYGNESTGRHNKEEQNMCMCWCISIFV